MAKILRGREVYFLEIHDAKLFAPGHTVNRWAHEIARELKVLTVLQAPPNHSESKWGHKGTGRLVAGIDSYVTENTAKQLNIYCESSAPYTRYVHDGTAFQGLRYIYSTEGWQYKAHVDSLVKRGYGGARNAEGDAGLYMVLPPGGGTNKRFFLRVHGQRKNPFLIKGYNSVARKHRSLKPMRLR